MLNKLSYNLMNSLNESETNNTKITKKVFMESDKVVIKESESYDDIKSPSNKFYIGDVCYVLDDKIYDEIWGGKHDYADGLIDCENGLSFLVHGTAYGDGEYYDQYGHPYGVDAGVIGVVPIELCAKEDGLKLGAVMEGNFATLEYDDGTFKIEIGNNWREIYTKEDFEDEEWIEDEEDDFWGEDEDDLEESSNAEIEAAKADSIEKGLYSEAEHDLSKDILGDEANKRMSRDQEAYEKYLQLARDIKDGKNETITLDSAKHLLKNAYIKANCLLSFEPEEIDKRIAKEIPDLFGEELTEAEEVQAEEKFAIYGDDETYPVIKRDGKYLITREHTSDFSGDWELLGIVRIGRRPDSMISPEEALNIEDWKYKNGNPKYTVVDLDHGTRRTWGGMYNGRPRGISSFARVDDNLFSMITESEEIKEEPKTITEAEVNNIKTVKTQGNIFMLEDDNKKFIVGENYNEAENIIENAEIYDNKEEADKDYLDRCEIIGGTVNEGSMEIELGAEADNNAEKFQDYLDFCNDLGIDSKSEESITKYINEFSKNQAQYNGIENLEKMQEELESLIRTYLNNV